MSQVRWKKWLNTFFLYSRVPFNWKTKFGYLVFVVFFIVGGLTLTISASATICLCIGLFLLMISFIEDATNDLIRLNVDENFKSYDFDVKMRFRSAAQAHSDLKELCNEHNNFSSNLVDLFSSVFNFCRFIDEFCVIHKFKILVVFFWSILTIFTSILIFLTELVEYETHTQSICISVLI